MGVPCGAWGDTFCTGNAGGTNMPPGPCRRWWTSARAKFIGEECINESGRRRRIALDSRGSCEVRIKSRKRTSSSWTDARGGINGSGKDVYRHFVGWNGAPSMTRTFVFYSWSPPVLHCIFEQ